MCRARMCVEAGCAPEAPARTGRAHIHRSCPARWCNRLAPEHSSPGAVDDSYAALEWVGEHLAEMARPGAPLFVARDSPGGNLAAVMALRARDRGDRHCRQILI